MKHIDIKSITYIDFDVENSAKGLEFKVGYHVRIWKYKSISLKGYSRSWSIGSPALKNLKILYHWNLKQNTLMVKKQPRNWWSVLRKWIAKKSSTEFRVEKLLNKKYNNLYVKWKSYYNLVNDLIRKK